MATDVQFACSGNDFPTEILIKDWVSAALPRSQAHADLTIRIVDTEESHGLNLQYRGHDKPTNVLSFEADLPDGLELALLGDVVICAPVAATEAAAQNKTVHAHFAHLVVHGTLHLLGYDHIDEGEATEMEDLERRVLVELGFADPYLGSGA